MEGLVATHHLGLEFSPGGHSFEGIDLGEGSCREELGGDQELGRGVTDGG
jgi:hypothetical protein